MPTVSPAQKQLTWSREGSDPLQQLEALAVTKNYRRGEEIYGPEDEADHWYRVVSGMGRKTAVRADGRRMIVDLLLPGEYFGMGTNQEHRFATEAVTEGTAIARYPRRRAEQLADNDPKLSRRLREVAFEAASRSQARLLILGRMSAVERVGAFLVELARRSADRSAHVLVLDMSRYDIGDYLALSAETVSRAITDLRHRGIIRLSGNYRVTIVNPDALEESSCEY